MATIDLGRLGFVNKGTYNNSTTYEKNDLVQFTDGGILSTYLYIDSSAQSGQAPSSSGTVGSRWVYYAKGGAAGTDVGTTLTTQGDMLYRDGSGLARLAKGTAGNVLKQGANHPEWGAISAGVTKYCCFRPSSNMSGTLSAGEILVNTFSGSELNANGTFTASEAGNYYFHRAVMHANNGGSAFGVQLKKNGNTIGGGQMYVENYDDMASTAVIVDLAVNDTLTTTAGNSIYANYGCSVIMKLN